MKWTTASSLVTIIDRLPFLRSHLFNDSDYDLDEPSRRSLAERSPSTLSESIDLSKSRAALDLLLYK